MLVDAMDVTDVDDDDEDAAELAAADVVTVDGTGQV